jgi:hypothetical protein
MDELPREARALIEQARSWDGPPDDARARVRRNVALAVTAAAAGSSASHASAQQSALWSGATAKLRWLACAAVLGGGALLLRQSMTAAPAARKPAPTQELSVPQPTAAPAVSPGTTAAPTLPSDASPLPESPSMPLPAASQNRAQPRAAASGPTHLAAEMALLHEVSQALNQGELARAGALLREHRQRFSRGQLSAEREGLRVLAQCMGHEAHASERASVYLRRAPDGVLAARIENACAAGKQP